MKTLKKMDAREMYTQRKTQPSASSAGSAGPAEEADYAACPGCRGNQSRHDRRHNRVPGRCRYPHDAPVAWSCPGCMAGAHGAPRPDHRHTHIHGECRWAEAAAHLRAGRAEARNPRVASAQEPTAALRDVPRLDEEPAAGPPVGAAVEHPVLPLRDDIDPPGASMADDDDNDNDDNDNDDSHTAARRRRGPAPRADAEVQVGEPPDWSQWDLGRALQALRSTDIGVLSRTLRRLHVRLWHAPAQRLRDLCDRAGVPKTALDMIQNVVDTCRACREWQRRSARPIGALTLCSHFNEGLQFDLIFLDDEVAIHLICLAIRFTQA